MRPEPRHRAHTSTLPRKAAVPISSETRDVPAQTPGQVLSSQRPRELQARDVLGAAVHEACIGLTLSNPTRGRQCEPAVPERTNQRRVPWKGTGTGSSGLNLMSLQMRAPNCREAGTGPEQPKQCGVPAATRQSADSPAGLGAHSSALCAHVQMERLLPNCPLVDS